jgi:hypothetical protein
MPPFGFVSGKLHAVVAQLLGECGVGRRVDHAVLLDQLARRDAAHGDDLGDAELRRDIEERSGEAVLPGVLDGLVVADEDEQVPAGIDRVNLDAREFRDPVLVDPDLWREVLGVDPSDGLALELLDEVFCREFADVADAGQPLDQNRIVELGIGQFLDLDLVHGATRGVVV